MKGFERRIAHLEAKRTDPHAQTWIRIVIDPRAGDDERTKVAEAITKYARERGHDPDIIVRRIVDSPHSPKTLSSGKLPS
jgi:hypothetical protein